MSELEFKTFRAISRPGKKIPGFNDEELIFLLFYYLIAIVSMILFLGIFPQMLKIKLTAEFQHTWLLVFFVLVPIISFIIIKAASIGKQEGYVFQRFYSWLFSGLPNVIDTRNYEDRKMLVNWNRKKLAFFRTQKTFQKTTIQELKNYSIKWDPVKEAEKIKLAYENTEIMFDTYLRNKKQRKWEIYSKYFKELEENLNFWNAYYYRLNKNKIDANNSAINNEEIKIKLKK